MNQEKIVVVLLLLTIILSIASIAVTFSFNSETLFNSGSGYVQDSNNGGNVQFVLQASGEENENN